MILKFDWLYTNCIGFEQPDICLLFDDITIYLNLIGVQDSLHAESAQPKIIERQRSIIFGTTKKFLSFSMVVGAAGDETNQPTNQPMKPNPQITVDYEGIPIS